VVLGDGSLPSYEGLVDAGIVEYVEFPHRPWPTSTLLKLCDGFRPKDPQDPNSPLRPATTQELKDTGLYLFEGIAVAGNYIMGHVKGGYAQQAAEGVKFGPDPAIRFFDGELDPQTGQPKGDGQWYGNNGAAHYGQAQGILINAIQRSRGLPAHVAWTTHEILADQQVNVGDMRNPNMVRIGEVVIGPEAAGKALTPIIHRIFGHTLRMAKVVKKNTGQVADEHTGVRVRELDTEYRIYTRDHFNAEGVVQVRYLANTRDVPADFPQYFSDEVPGVALMKFYQKLAELRLKDAEI
jgi:hypothetical protein